MSRLKPENLKLGDVFIEHDSFHGNITAKVTQEPYIADEFEGKNQWRWKAVNVENGAEIDYLLTEGFEHYGPRIYSEGSVLLPRRLPEH